MIVKTVVNNSRQGSVKPRIDEFHSLTIFDCHIVISFMQFTWEEETDHI